MISSIVSQLHLESRRLLEKFIAFAGSHTGFIRTVNGFRFIALLFLVIRFSLGSNEIMPRAIPYVLWGYFGFIIISHFLADFQPRRFDSKLSKSSQVVLDVLFISLFYAATGDLKSDVFQLYILPLLLVARYARRLRELVGFLTMVIFSTFVIWSVFYQISPMDFTPALWVSRLVPRAGFLVLLTIIYTVYQRRRRLFSDLKSIKEDLLVQHRGLNYGVFSIDQQLRITGFNEHFQLRYDNTILNQPYYVVFCPNARKPHDCPLTLAITKNKFINRDRIDFFDPVHGAYPVQLSITPILSKQKNIVGATVMVTNLQAREAFEQSVFTYVASQEFLTDDDSLNYQAQFSNEAQKLKAITEATGAVLSPNQPLGVKKILQRMAELLRSQLSDVRLYNEQGGQEGLWLSYTFGYPLEEAKEWYFLDLKSPSIVAQAYKKKQSFFAYDVQKEQRAIKFTEKAQQYGLHSAVAFPMIARGEVLGTVSMYRNRREGFSDTELYLGQAFANSLAATLHNQQLLNQVSDQATLQASQLNALSEFSQSLSAQKDLLTLAQSITTFTRKHLNTEVASLFLLQGNTLYRKAIAGIDEKWFEEEAYPIGQGLTGRAITDKTIVCENDIATSSKVIIKHRQRYQRKLASGYVRQLMAVPLLGPEGPIGVLRIVNKLDKTKQIDPVGFTSYDQDLLKIISYNVAVSIHGAYQAEEQEFLLELAGIASRSPYNSEILSHSLNKVTTLLGAEAGALILPDEVNQQMIFTYIEGDLAEDLSNLHVPITHSIVGQVFQNKEPALISDVSADPNFYYAIEAKTGVDFRSLLVVPIKTGVETFGVLALINKRIGNFTQRDQALLASLASWIAIAQKNYNLFSELKERARIQRELNRQASIFIATSNYTETLNEVAKGIKELLNFDMAGVGIFDRRTREIRAIPDCGVIGIAPEYVSSLRFDVSLPGGEVLRTGKICSTFDAQTDTNSIFGQELTELIGARAIVAAPLLVGEREVGILYAAQQEPRQFTPEEEQIFEAYARQAAVTIRNTELLDELQARVATLDSLRASALHASETDNLQEVLSIIARATNDLLKSDITFIAPFATHEQALDIALSVTVGGRDDAFKHSPDARERGLTKRVLNNSDGVVIIEDFAEFPPELAGDFVRSQGIQSCVAVRLEFKNEIVGVLYVNFFHKQHFSDEAINTLKLFATHVAMIIHNFNLVRRNEDMVKERARERLREDLHSLLGSFHSRIMFATERLSRQMQIQGHDEFSLALERLWQSSSSIYRQMERILHDMRDTVLSEKGLPVALDKLIESYSDEVNIDLSLKGVCEFSPDVELALYRITDECVHNIIKHAKLDSRTSEPVAILLDTTATTPRLIIRDCGKGFDPNWAKEYSTGLGLRVIQNWARRIQAECEIKSKIEQGTTVIITIWDKDVAITP